jgi:hypothetical protein
MSTPLLFRKTLFHICDGLGAGLSRFSGPSRVAVVYALEDTGPVFIHDPQDLLREHEPKIREIFSRFPPPLCPAGPAYDGFIPCADVQLSGIISFGARSAPLPLQMWFTDHHPDICSVLPTQRWLEQACRLMVQSMESRACTVENAGFILHDFALHAVRDAIVDERSRSIMDSRLRVYTVLAAILDLSKAREEGRLPVGEMAFVEPDLVDTIHYMAKLDPHERPLLQDTKHVRKLLQAVEGTRHRLVCDGTHIIGIGAGRLPDYSIGAEFLGSYGFISLQEEKICSFADGSLHSSTREPILVALEETLVEMRWPAHHIYGIMHMVLEIVKSAQERRHGCALILDYGTPLAHTSGQRLTSALNLRRLAELDLAKTLARVDGALHIDIRTLRLVAFATLMDGKAVPAENRARGARYNSALRFSAEHPDLFVVVVSADRPISIIQHGAELSTRCEWQPQGRDVGSPLPLEQWASP